MIPDPQRARRRDDLPYLRRRSRPRATVQGASPPVAGKISFDRPGRTRTRPAPAPAGPAASPAAPPPGVPAVSPAPASSSPAPASSSLDLDEPAPAAAAPAAAAPAPPVAAAPPGVPVTETSRPARRTARVAAGARVILAVAQPEVTLTRLQSAIGTLTFEAATSSAAGDMRLGCAYELGDGYSSTVQLAGGNRFAPPRARRPVIVASREQFDRIALDLRQARQLRRLGVYAFSESRQAVRWEGTLVGTTLGGARVELPLEPLQGGNVAMLLTLYNVRGEFVLRGEMQSFVGGVRDAVRAYGYDRITWLDDRTPVE